MTDFYTNNLVCQVAEIQDDLYERLKTVRAALDEPLPDWYNPHDFASGYAKGSRKATELEYEFLANILDKMERS